MAEGAPSIAESNKIHGYDTSLHFRFAGVPG